MVETKTNGFFSHRGVGVKVTGVKKHYRTAAEEIHALTDIDWDVESGQALAIMGPSGCGKTTLLNLIGGVDRPTFETPDKYTFCFAEKRGGLPMEAAFGGAGVCCRCVYGDTTRWVRSDYAE